MSMLAPMIDAYLAGPPTLRAAVADMHRDQLLARPVQGKWSTLEVVCHLADFDTILADRMKRVIAEERPSLVGADETCFARALAYQQRDVQEELSLIDLSRRQLGRILRTLTDDDLTRVGVHNERGPRTLEQLLKGATDHIHNHLKHIHEKRQALGLPPVHAA